jgi:hypothetical protein
MSSRHPRHAGKHGIAVNDGVEAEHTISGSIGSLKAAFSNLIVGFGDSQADMKQLCGNVVDAFSDVLTKHHSDHSEHR